MTGYSIKARLKTEKQNYLAAHAWYLLIFMNNLCFSNFHFARTAIYLQTDTLNYFPVCVVGGGGKKRSRAHVHTNAHLILAKTPYTLLKCLYFHLETSQWQFSSVAVQWVTRDSCFSNTNLLHYLFT